MLALKTSFQSLYEQTKQQGHQVCINCPLHQYHKLCEDITGTINKIKGDNCIQNFHLGKYIIGYTVGNLVLWRQHTVADR